MGTGFFQKIPVPIALSCLILYSVCPALLSAACSSFVTRGKVMVTLNRSPSRYRSNVPPCISVKDFAMESPSPLPSVLRDTSHRIKCYVSSSASMFSGCSDTFFRLKVTVFSLTVRSA